MNTTAKVSKVSELIGITDKACTDLSDENPHNIKVGMAIVPVYDQVAETVVPSVFVPLKCTMQDCRRPLDVSVVIARGMWRFKSKYETLELVYLEMIMETFPASISMRIVLAAVLLGLWAGTMRRPLALASKREYARPS